MVHRSFLYNPTNLKVPKKAPCLSLVLFCASQPLYNCLLEQLNFNAGRGCLIGAASGGAVISHYDHPSDLVWKYPASCWQLFQYFWGLTCTPLPEFQPASSLQQEECFSCSGTNVDFHIICNSGIIRYNVWSSRSYVVNSYLKGKIIYPLHSIVRRS